MAGFKNIISISTLVCILYAGFLIASNDNWKRKQGVIGNDVISYYAYLPAIFIFHDIKLEKKETYELGVFWPETLPNGAKVIKTTMGLSILYSPFFFAAHFYEKLIGDNAFGFSNSYQLGLLIAALFYFFIGLIFLKKILSNYFSEKITAITILAVALGTNLLYYVSGEGAMSHVFNFTLFNIFIWLTILWDRDKKVTQLLLIGAIAGLISLVRPSNIIILLFFFLFGIYSKATLTERLKHIFGNFHWYLLMGFVFILVWMPQFIYWKITSGSFFFYSYGVERFYFNNPHFIDGLFSYRKGWLVYTPIMVFSLIGIPLLFTKLKEFSWAVTTFTLVNLYIICSWWCWWYGGSYGMRALIDFYGMLAVPFALFLTHLEKTGKVYFRLAAIVCFLLIALNLFNVEKYKKGAIHWDSMTKEAFWFNFMHKYPQHGYWELLQQPDYDNARQGKKEVLKPAE